MIPIPQTPWTLAIAELIAQRMAAAGSAQPADVLANVLFGGETPPDGWLDRFIAGTPMPDYVTVSSNPNSSLPSSDDPGSVAPLQEGDSLSKAAGADASQLATQLEAMVAEQPTVTLPSMSGDTPGDSLPQVGWEAVNRIVKEGGSKPNIGAIVRALCPQSAPPDGGFSSPQIGRMDPRTHSTPPIFPSTTPGNSTAASGPPAGTIGSSRGGGRPIEITVVFDPRKFVAEMKLIAETIAHRIVDRQNLIYASQTRGGRRH